MNVPANDSTLHVDSNKHKKLFKNVERFNKKKRSEIGGFQEGNSLFEEIDNIFPDNLDEYKEVFPNYAVQRDPFEPVIRKKRNSTNKKDGKITLGREKFNRRLDATDGDLSDDDISPTEEIEEDIQEEVTNVPQRKYKRFGDMAARIPNADTSLKHRQGEEAPADIVDPVFLFLTVSLPTALCFGLLLAFCIFALNPRGQICSTIFPSAEQKKHHRGVTKV